MTFTKTNAVPTAENQLRSAENQLGYPGWRVAVVCHIGVLTGFATVFIYSFSFMVQPLQQAFGWDREEIARAFSLAAISVAIFSPFIGKLFDRFDPRKLIAGFMTAFGLGMASLAFLRPHLWQLYASAVFIGIAGTGTYQLGYARVIAAWFERRLGAALSIVVAGSGVGSFVVPPLVAHLLATHGWRATYLGLAALPLFVGAPLTLVFARSPQAGSAHESKYAMRGETAEGRTWQQALGSLTFWLLVLGVVALSLSENGALAHLAPMLSDHGLKASEIAFTASLLGIASVTGRFVLGWLLDFVKGSHIAVASLVAGGRGDAAAGPCADIRRRGSGSICGWARRWLRTGSDSLHAAALFRPAFVFDTLRNGLQHLRRGRSDCAAGARAYLRQNRFVYRDSECFLRRYADCVGDHVRVAEISIRGGDFAVRCGWR